MKQKRSICQPSSTTEPWVHAHVTRSNSAITNYFDKRSKHKTEKTIQEEQARQQKEEKNYTMSETKTTGSSTSTGTPTILVTGGCGYIGSHTITCLLEKNYNVVVVDNLCNSSKQSLDQVTKIVGLSDDERKERLVFHSVDICDKDALRKVFEVSPTFTSCIHFAGLKVRNLRLFLFYFGVVV